MLTASTRPPRVAVILAAGGRGTRFGSDRPKTLLECHGRPLWRWSLETLSQHPAVTSVVVVAPSTLLGAFSPQTGDRHQVVAGGKTRAASVYAGLTAIAKNDRDLVDFVAVHDAARPLIRPSDFADLLAAAFEMGAAILATPVVSTVKRTDAASMVVETVSRESLWAAQTPQVARFDWLQEAYEHPDANLATDEAALIEQAGYPVRVVEGSSENLKVTRPVDADLAALLLARRDQRDTQDHP